MPLRHFILPAVLLVVSACAPLLRSAEPASPALNPEAMALGKIVDSALLTDAERLEACDKLKAMGKDAAAAAPVLIDALRRREPMPTHAADALIAIGPAAIPALRAAMKLEERETFAACGLTWAAIDVKAGVSLQTLLHRLETAETFDRYEAALAIARLQPPNGVLHIRPGGKAEGQEEELLTTLAALMQARINDPSFVVRNAANVALGNLRDREAGREPKLSAADSLALAPEVQWDRDYRRDLIKEAEAADNLNRISVLRKIARYGSDAHDVAGTVRRYLDDADGHVREAAYETLFAMGDTGLPYWLDALESHDTITRRFAMKALADPWLNKFARHETLVARLEPLLKDPDPNLCDPAATALCAMWPQSEPALTRAMKSGNDAVKRRVIQHLFEKGGDLAYRAPQNRDESAPPIPTPPIAEDFAEFEAQLTPELLRSLSADDIPVRGLAFEALRQFRSSKARRQLVEVLQAQLKDRAAGISQDAARHLVRLGPEATSALIAGTRSKDYFIRATCASGLMIQVQAGMTNDAGAVAAATAALGDRAHEVRDVALTWVEKLRQPPPGAIDQLAAWLSPPTDVTADRINLDERSRAVAILGQWAVEPKKSVPAIMHGLDNSEQMMVQLAAIRALRGFGADAAPAVPPIARFLEQDNLSMAQAATETLLALGPEGRRLAMGFLIRTLKGPGGATDVAWAIKVLSAIGPAAAPAVPALAALLSESDNSLRTQVALALGSIGPEARSAIPSLTRMADNRDPDVREAASESLLRISPDGKGLGPALIAAVMNHDRVCADRLAAVMVRSGEAQAMRVRLTDLANTDPDTRVRATARRAVEFLSSK